MENVVQEKVHNLESDNNYTFRIRTFNNISTKGLSQFSLDTFDVGPELDNADAYICRSHKLHGNTFQDTVKAIGRAGAGVNNIPVDECTKTGIVVFNSPGANANAVKELVVAGMILASRDIIGGVNFVQSIANEGDDLLPLVEKNKATFSGTELSGKTLGVVGLGAIGLQVANVGLSLGMNVQGFDPFISVDAAWELSSQVSPSGSLERLIRESDYISVHVPYTDNTKGFINAERIEAMKSGAVLLNFSRNGLVDEVAMKSALNDGHVKCYVSDFPNPLLVNHPKVISIPHLGASTKEAEDNCAVMVANQLNDFLLNGNITNSVNFPSIKLDRSTPYRVTVVNRNVPKMIGHLSSIIADANVNISEMVNKSRNDIAYNMIDLDQPLNQQVIDQILNVDGVIRVRELPVYS
ncbi:MAG: phosphoglycerate dehydrogenase [Candidatus Margulisbacteria bacterium]|nr:phosphoglycerate dehydrogenase [Candidatus Margulisiibacteriota bacterium]